ncbi:hypothetical protein GOBAR_DD02678 [Gossypium barbadense]|nr:hypothetical protein GOBAR_DD13340 [Gossypium barbadense]PPE00287.1 hypothetical protein GOBAR_DD02678 [Gossypium barbadense]
MAIRVPRIMHAKQILRHSKLFANQAASDSTVVPKGYIAVYVGESQKKRFIVPISFLNQPSFQKLLTIGSTPENIQISFQPKPAILLAFLWKVTINIFPRKIGLSLLMPKGLEQTMKVSFVWYDGQSLGTACEDIGGKIGLVVARATSTSYQGEPDPHCPLKFKLKIKESFAIAASWLSTMPVHYLSIYIHI